MEDSILTSTKKILGLAEVYTIFDLDILTHINAAFSILNQLDIGPSGFSIQDNLATWSNLNLPADQLNLVRTYIFLKVRLHFDPPGTSFLLQAMKEQLDQYEWRLTVMRDEELAAEEVA